MNNRFENTLSPPDGSMAPNAHHFGNKPASSWIFKLVVLGILCIILMVIIAAWMGVRQYNKVQELNERVSANLDHTVNQYMRRADLIPKLNRAIDSFSNNEKELIKSIAKSQLIAAKSMQGSTTSTNIEAMNEFIKAQSSTDLMINQLILNFRNRSTNQAGDLYMGLMVQIEGTENRISHARSNYIEAVSAYNVSLKVLPMQLVVGRLGLEPKVNYFKDYIKLLNSPS